MSTENRSSNTEMVSVPRDIIEFAVGFKTHGFKNPTEQHNDQRHAQDKLRAILAQPTQQHQGEPVAWLVTALKGSLAGQHAIVPESTSIDRELYLGPFPVFAHADPGEVEQLNAEIAELLVERNDLRAELEDELAGWKECCRRLNDESMARMRDNDTLRAQLAERSKQLDNALNDLEGLIGTVRYYDKNHQLHNEEGSVRRYRAALSAST